MVLMYDVNALDSFVFYNHTIIVYSTENGKIFVKYVRISYLISNNDI